MLPGDCCLAGRLSADSSPRRTPGAGVLFFAVRFGACRRLKMIGRVSPRRVTTFLVATRKVDKETPPAAPPASPVPSLRPRPAGRVETRPAGSDSDATIPAGHGLHSAVQKGRGCQLGFAIAGRVLRVCCQEIVVWLGVCPRIRRPSECRGPVFCLSLFGSASVINRR